MEPRVNSEQAMVRGVWSSDADCTASPICVAYYHASANEMRLWGDGVWPWDALACWGWCLTQGPQFRVFVYPYAETASVEERMTTDWYRCTGTKPPTQTPFKPGDRVSWIIRPEVHKDYGGYTAAERLTGVVIRAYVGHITVDTGVPVPGYYGVGPAPTMRYAVDKDNISLRLEGA